ncbi:MAG: sugar ABC transporter permease [Spirochaetales bacterium]|nr:sugar ABC transporter permease [Spirochaetales bacterium]
MIFALLFLWILFGVLSGGTFVSPRNISNLFRQMTIISFLAIGMVLIIVTGNIDLSVGSATGFIATVVAYFQVYIFHQMIAPFFTMLFPAIPLAVLGVLSTVFALVISLITGSLIGLWNGVIVAYLKVPAFIVTLGGLLIFRGLMIAVTGGKSISPLEKSLGDIYNGYLPKEIGLVLAFFVICFIAFAILRQRNKRKKYGLDAGPLVSDIAKICFFSGLVAAYVLFINSYYGVQVPVLVMAIVAFLFAYLSGNTRLGRYAYAIGGNMEAARLSGINIKTNIMKVFILMGALIGVAGVVLAARVGTGAPGGGETYELYAIAACVIGGTSLMGGEGTILGALIGSLVMASLDNGMVLLNIPSFAQYVIKGLVLVFAVWVDVATRKTRE